MNHTSTTQTNRIHQFSLFFSNFSRYSADSQSTTFSPPATATQFSRKSTSAKQKSNNRDLAHYLFKKSDIAKIMSKANAPNPPLDGKSGEKTNQLGRSLVQNVRSMAKQIAEEIYLDVLVSLALNISDYMTKDCCNPNAPTDCDDKVDGYYPVAACCKYYLKCYQGQGILLVRNDLIH